MRPRTTNAIVALTLAACGTSGSVKLAGGSTGSGGSSVTTGGSTATTGSTMTSTSGATSTSTSTSGAIATSTSSSTGTASTSTGTSSSGSSTSGSTTGGVPMCTPGGDGGYLSAPYTNLSEYCLVGVTDAGLTPLPGAVPYDLNTPFFADYAIKLRTVWMPPGTSATYDPSDVPTFPIGTIFTKSFGWPDDERKANPVITWIETRVETLVDGGWELNVYTWNDAGTDATLSHGGVNVPITFIFADGGPLTATHLIPSEFQCAECHYNSGNNTPIGPKARQLNGNFTYPDGTTQNQLGWWTDAGILTGAPTPSSAPILPVWDDPTTGTVEQRARAYLESNCAHCHNPNGYAASTGLTFWASDQVPADYGVCQLPTNFNFAGEPYILVPDDTANSLLVYLLSSTTDGALMPPLGRSLEDIEGTTLVDSWISGIDGGGLDGGIDGGCG